MPRREIPRRLLLRATAQAGLVSRRQILDHGVSSHRVTGMVDHGEWSRVTRGVYAVLPHYRWRNVHDQRRERAAWTGLLSADPRGIATGRCALALHGAWGLEEDLVPEITLPGGASAPGARGVRVRRFREPMGLCWFGDFLIASPVTALIQALPEMSRDRFVMVVDSALQRCLISDADLERVRDGVRGRRGAAKLHDWWPLVDRESQSPNETWARLQALDAGLPAPVLQAVVRNGSGRIIANGDLGWLRADGTWGLAEVDGKEVHDTPEALFRDRARQNAVALADRHTQLRFTARDLARGAFVPTIREALRLP